MMSWRRGRSPRSRRDFRPRTGISESRQRSERVLGKGAIVGLVILTALFMGGLALAYWSADDQRAQGRITQPSIADTQISVSDDNLNGMPAASAALHSANFDHCGIVRRTCVVDGDTFWLEGVKVRIMDIDTPEVSRPQCASEKALGDRATVRLIELLNAGPFEMQTLGGRDEDQYGRKLRVIVRDGQSIGDQLVAEGLARTWSGRREPWC